jgi:hypothetical protein
MNDPLDGLLEGAIDLHVHPSPSPFPRRIDIVEAAKQAAAVGMRAIAVKSHHHSTAMDVAAMERYGVEQSGVQVVGGISLNTQVGGINPHAVNLCLAMGGKIVWFPTIASPAHIAHSHNLNFPKLAIPLIDETPIDVWGDDGKLTPEVYQIVGMIAEADAILASGHMPVRSILAVFEAAREAGVRRMVVNHPNYVIEASYEEARKMTDLGAMIEHSLCMYDEESTFYHWSLDVLVDWIRAVGPEKSLLGSDLGQNNNPLPEQSYHKICSRLLEAGWTRRELRMLVADNPAKLLGVSG